MASEICLPGFTFGLVHGILEKKVGEHLTEPGGARRRYGARIAHFGLVPLSIVTTAIDSALGIGAGIPFIFTRGKSRKFDIFVAGRLHKGLDVLLARPYLNLLRTINPDAKTDRYLGFCRCEIETHHDGWLTAHLHEKIENVLKKCTSSQNFCKREILSRIGYGFTFIASVVTRVIDMTLGIFAMIASFAYRGRHEGLNRFAYKTLRITGIVSDFFIYASRMWNPHG